jgi:hypothetical protein
MDEPLVEPSVSLQIGREFKWEPEESHEPGVRRVWIDYSFESLGPDAEEEVVLWSDEFPTLQEFLSAVEGTAAFQVASKLPVAGVLMLDLASDDQRGA